MTAAAIELLEPRALAEFLDAHGLGEGPLTAERIGAGSSNLTYLLRRGATRIVLRRPPPPPLPASAHDMVREARIQIALAGSGVPVPRVLAVCEDEHVLGVPFYVMEELVGVVPDALPPDLDVPPERHRLGVALVDALAELHAVDWQVIGLDGLGRPSGYLERQLRRWTGLWEANSTIESPAFLEVAELLRSAVPQSPPATLVHGDYRPGNVMVAPSAPAQLVAVLDWEMATIGDPLADLGYFVATWDEPSAARHPMLLSPITAAPGFPGRDELVRRYAEQTGRDVSALRWYQALALWKSAVFCDAIYARYRRGERDDEWAAGLETGVPRLVEVARSLL